jgi:type VI secretion system secreted protein Hcp
MQAIRSATGEAGRAPGIHNSADLIAVEGDPLLRMSDLCGVRIVMKKRKTVAPGGWMETLDSPGSGCDPGRVRMADYFLKIDGIEGESSDAQHKNEIEVESFNWSEQRQASGGGGTASGGRSGKAIPSTFHFAARVSKASPKLMLACATGQFSRHAVLTARKSGQVQFEFLSITLTDVQVSAYEISGSASDDTSPTDNVGLSFASLQMSYTVQEPDGSPGAIIFEGFDFRTNKKI